jgi:transcriptional regulator with XRE-family HTH domain
MSARLMLVEARRRSHLSQAALAARCGLQQPAVSRIERGQVDPSVETLHKLLEACGESLEAVPRLGAGVDRTLLRENLERTPPERLRHLISAARAVARLREAATIG